MEQEIPQQPIQPQIPPTDKNKNLLAIVASMVVTALVVGVGVYFFLNKSPKQPETNNTLPNETVSQTPETSSTNKTVYFGKGSQGKYSLVNVQTGETQDFIPAGYTLLNQLDYQIFPTFLILQKDNDLYSYSVENKIVNSVFGSFNDLKLKKDKQARVYPSITEKDKFIIQIDTLDLSPVYYDISPPVLSTRTYSFDASTNKLVAIANGEFGYCAKYDSKNQRFFTWRCGEGIGSALPLSISDLNGNVKSQVITAKDFGAANDDLIDIEFKNGLFFALNNNDKDIKILVLNPSLVSPSKEIYIATAQVNSKISDISTYSMGIDRSTNTLIIGGNSDILLLRFDTNKQITQSTYIPDKDVYANFIFPNAGKLYYQAKDNIRVVNLNSWQIEKSIPSSGSFSEITLFAF